MTIYPEKFCQYTQRLILPTLYIGLLCTVIACCWGLFLTPADYQQGDMVRLMYIHVPTAWLGTAIYAIMALCSGVYLVWKNILFKIIAASLASTGFLYTSLTLITGILWGKPIWGTWWIWDARLTSVLLLWILYLAFITLNNSINHLGTRAIYNNKSSSILLIIGAINLPIIKWSVEWWHTLHQPASFFRLFSKDNIITAAREFWGPVFAMLIGLLLIATSISLQNTYSLWRKRLIIKYRTYETN